MMQKQKYAMPVAIVLYCICILVLFNDMHYLLVCRISPGPSSLPGLQDWNQVLRVAQ
jgi:hypothetical protein